MTNQEVIASLQYLVPTGESPIYVASRGGADAALSISAEFEARDVHIHNARNLTPTASLDREGFALVEHITAIEDFYADNFDRAQYETEVSELIVAVTGAKDVVVFDHTLRSDSAQVRGLRSTRETASVIHNDYTDASAQIRVRDLLGEEEANLRFSGRFAIINVWRSVGGIVWRSPLTCCDASTLNSADLIASERRSQDRIGEIELVSWNPAHRWFYYPEMTGSEVLLLKTFDSSEDGRATRTVHSAFSNPLAPPDAPPRESIESRLLVFY